MNARVPSPRVNAVQTIVLNGAATGGSFTLSFNGLTTGAINYNATPSALAANIQAALSLLTPIGLLNALVTAINPNTYAVAFQNFLAGAPIPQMSINTQNLTPAGPVTATVGTTTAGVSALNLNGGTLIVGNSSLVSGGLNITSGNLQTTLTTGLSVPYFTNLNNASLTLGGSNSLVLDGPLVALNGTNNAINVTNTGTSVISGIMFGTSNLVVGPGAGTLVLSGTNAYTGTTTILAGATVQAQNNQAFGIGAGAIVSVASGGGIKLLGGGLTIANPLVLNGAGTDGSGVLRNLVGGSNTLSGTITLQTNVTFGADAGTTLTDNGVITGGGNLTKLGQGTLVLNQNNTFVGNTVVSAGIVNVQNANGLGLPTVAGGSVTVSSGASLQLQTTVSGKTVSLNGTGFGNTAGQSSALPEGALVNLANNNTWAGNILLNGTLAWQRLDSVLGAPTPAR